MMKNLKQIFKATSLLLTLCMILSMIPITAFAIGTDAQNHTHDEICGYSEALEGHPCQHEHDETCGYSEGISEVPCDMECADIDEDGAIIHAKECAYQAAVEATTCQHEHNETCGYAEPIEGAPCLVQPVIDAMVVAITSIENNDENANHLIDTALEAYNELTAEQQAEVTNYTDFSEYREKYTIRNYSADTVAIIGDVEYSDLQTAVNAAVDGNVITLVIDLELSTSIMISAKTIGINGKSILRKAGYKGTLFTISDNAVVTFSDITISGQGNTALDAVIRADSSILNLNNVTFKNNVLSVGYYDTILNQETSSVIFARKTTITADETNFLSNSGVSTSMSCFVMGGVLNLSECNATFSNGVFSSNVLVGRELFLGTFESEKRVSENGSIASLNSGEYRFTSCQFTENIGQEKADGAIFIDDNIDLYITECTFQGNNARNGACIATPYNGYAEKNNRTIAIDRSEFLHNSATSEGGSLLFGGTNATITGSKFNYNTSGNGGAALFYTSSITVEDSEFNYNTVPTACSGAIHNWCSIIEMTDVDMCFNTARDEGGAMCLYTNQYTPDPDEDGIYHLDTARLIFNSGNISNNKTIGKEYDEDYTYHCNGGGIFVHTGGEFILNGGVIENNESAESGGGIYVDDESWLKANDTWGEETWSDTAGILIINGGIIRNNHAVLDGGGIYLNEVPSKNGPAEGIAASFTMNAGTIRDNTAAHNGGGLFIACKEDACNFEMNGGLLFDNLAGDETLYAGDDILDERQGATNVIFGYPSREYEDILRENVFLDYEGEIPEVPFIGWFVDDADNRFVSPTESTKILQSTTSTTGMKAIWGGYTVTYDANHGSGEQNFDAVAYAPDSEVAVKDNMFEYANHKFIGWNTEANGTGEWFRSAEQPSSSFIITSNMLLYAQWEETTLAGTLTISKTVTGSGDMSKEFTFTVTFTNENDAILTESFNYTGSGVADGTIKSGDAISLAHGQSITISGLPAGAKYEVIENEANQGGYTTTSSTPTGTISADAEAKAEFVNDKADTPNPPPTVETGRLTVSKTVTGGGDANALFTFRFTFSENGTYSYTGSKQGTISTGGTIQLKHGESVIITIPQGVTYTVIEDAVNSYVPTPSDRTFTGEITDTESRADFTNRYEEPYTPPVLTGNLTVKKTVTGDLADKTKEFAFTVTFDTAGSYSFIGSKSGTISSGDTVYLRHGEYITILNLPAGTSYTVTESGNSGYRVYKTGDCGVITANAEATAAFTNSKSSVPQTGDNNALIPWTIVMAISALGLISVLWLKKKRFGNAGRVRHQ